MTTERRQSRLAPLLLGSACQPHAIVMRFYSRFPIPDSRFPIPDSRFPIPDSRFPIPDSRP
ncbi:flagellar domain protein [Lysobacter antibioticus]|uniref:Flagellar domain protein n=1 Tax=Lysobacter antibioticus TaxID=84531 RepID=A0A0S2F3R8_LYSAN|nr:flagellar domain protein [Lysobacter antibioticus]